MFSKSPLPAEVLADLIEVARRPPSTAMRLVSARHSPTHTLAPRLFRSLKKGEREISKLDVTYEGDGYTVEFSGPEPLGANDLRTLQGLVGMAGPSKCKLPAIPNTPAGQALRAMLEMQGDAADKDTLVAVGSYRELAASVGYKNPNFTKSLRDCIERLWKVSIIVQVGSIRSLYRLLASVHSDSHTGSLLVALNPMIAQSVWGGKSVKYTHIELAEVRGLKTDVARLVHQRLCGWVDPGQVRDVSVKTLAEYAWPDPSPVTATTKKRNSAVRTAMRELSGVGWTTTEVKRGLYRIKRPNLVPHDIGIPFE